MVKGNKIYEDESDLHVRGVKIYAKSTADGYAYSDSACTKKMKADELVNLFNTNVVNIVDGGVTYKAIKLAVASETGVATLTYVKADTSTATTAVLATLRSE